MDKPTLETTIRKFVQAYPVFISFCWHGGEPLFGRTIDCYKQICDLQDNYRLRNQQIENRIQTNATLITREWAQFFKRYDFKVGISIDGPSWLNDRQRLTVNGDGTFCSIQQGINFLKEENIFFSVIMAVTNNTINHPKEIYEFITQEGFTTVNLNPCFGENDFAVDPIQYAIFMNQVFDLWFEEDRESLCLGFFDDILRWLLGGQPTVCHLRNSCYRHVRIDYNGDVLPCDDFLDPDFKFGNIRHQELSEIIASENYRGFYSLTTKYIAECLSCKWLVLCNGGCSRYSLNGAFQKRLNSMCESRKLIFEHIAQAVKG